mmetsp:Transcript_10212/g.14437  ORF Transcript_10212/g.14437 Transcript_10212/m.14437 type:complete len:135 (+) Transcript_10212:331-735(+)
MQSSKVYSRKISVSMMSMAIGIHYAGYELARSATLSMFTSSNMGFNNSSALPLAVALVSPFSVIMLWVSNKQRLCCRYLLYLGDSVKQRKLTLYYIPKCYHHHLENHHLENQINSNIFITVQYSTGGVLLIDSS